VADERPNGVMEEKQEFALLGLLFVGTDRGQRRFVSLGASEKDAPDLAETFAVDEVLDVTPAKIIRDDTDLVYGIMRLKSFERVAYHRPARELHELLRSRKATTLADAARQDHSNCTPRH
jgi:hypothetical protein